MRQRFPYATEHLYVFADRVAPLHPRKHRIGAVLRRHVQRMAHLREIPHRGDEVVCHVARVIRDEPNPIQARHSVELCEQIGQPCGPLALGPPVAVDRLADERDLAAALGHEFVCLG